jgi:plasmid stabilization system protein ParE
MILWTRQAKDDLREIKKFIARDAPRTARAFVWKLKIAVEQLSSFPESGRQVPELGRPSIREIVRGDYGACPEGPCRVRTSPTTRRSPS